MNPKIVVVGSSNTDMVVRADHLPERGETVLSDRFVMLAGGKGANQAVAAARLGAEVTFVAKLGTDLFGDQALAHFQVEGVKVDHIGRTTEAPSGVALIVVDRAGENIITVASGANRLLSAADVAYAEAAIAQADCVLLQLEIPLETVRAAIETAARHHVRVILNPAPARQLPLDLLAQVEVLTPNENEAFQLLGDKADRGAELLPQLAALGSRVVVMTCGSKGAMLWTEGQTSEVPAFPVNVVDTTGAGDAFNGALAVALARQTSWPEAVRYANAAAALAVTRVGAQTSLPTHVEVLQLLSGAAA